MNPTQQDKEHSNKKWAILTYIGCEIKNSQNYSKTQI